MSQSEIPTRPLSKTAKKKPTGFPFYVLLFYGAFASITQAILAARLLAPLTAYAPDHFIIISLVILSGWIAGFMVSGRLQHKTWIIPLSLVMTTFHLLISGWIVNTDLQLFSHPSLPGAVITAAAAFFLPAFFTGMAGIAAIRTLFEEKPPPQVISALGGALAAAAAGAGLGILCSQYIFLPWVGIAGTLKGLTFTWACLSLYFLNRSRKVLAVIAILLCVVLPAPAFWQGNGVIRLERMEGHQDTFSVVSDGTILRLDSATRPGLAQTLLGTYQPQLEYANKLIDLAGNVFERRVLVIGGAGHMLAHVLENRGAYVVETTADLAAASLADRFFQPIQGLYIVQDGRTYLENAGDLEFDVIVIDADGEGILPPHLTTLEFFQLVNNHLAFNGRVVYHLTAFPGVEGTDIFGAFSATLSAVFYEVCQPIVDDPQPYGVMLVASQDTLFDVSCTKPSRIGALMTDDRSPLSFHIQALAGKGKQ